MALVMGRAYHQRFGHAYARAAMFESLSASTRTSLEVSTLKPRDVTLEVYYIIRVYKKNSILNVIFTSFYLSSFVSIIIFMKHELVIQVLLINNSIHYIYRCQLLQLACVYVRLLHHVMLDVR